MIVQKDFCVTVSYITKGFCHIILIHVFDMIMGIVYNLEWPLKFVLASSIWNDWSWH